MRRSLVPRGLIDKGVLKKVPVSLQALEVVTLSKVVFDGLSSQIEESRGKARST